jgi:hypothetical protein
LKKIPAPSFQRGHGEGGAGKGTQNLSRDAENTQSSAFEKSPPGDLPILLKIVEPEAEAEPPNLGKEIILGIEGEWEIEFDIHFGRVLLPIHTLYAMIFSLGKILSNCSSAPSGGLETSSGSLGPIYGSQGALEAPLEGLMPLPVLQGGMEPYLGGQEENSPRRAFVNMVGAEEEPGGEAGREESVPMDIGYPGEGLGGKFFMGDESDATRACVQDPVVAAGTFCHEYLGGQGGGVQGASAQHYYADGLDLVAPVLLLGPPPGSQGDPESVEWQGSVTGGGGNTKNWHNNTRK